MQRLKTLAYSLALVCAASGAALADGPGNRHEGQRGHEQGVGHSSHGNGHGYGHHKGGDSHGVPELDPNAAGGALILLIGGTLVLLERRRG